MDKTSSILASLAALGAVHTALAAEPPGKEVYEGTCIACHGANGKGPVLGVPDLTMKDGPLSKPDDVLVRHIINGLQTPGSAMDMPPKGDNPTLTEEQARQVLQYMREAFRR